MTSVENDIDLQGAYRDEQSRPFIRDIIVGVDDLVVESATGLDNALFNKSTYVLKVLRENDLVEVVYNAAKI